ncbi:carboxypeptidase-like regulatory domain-containing protein [uncultured Winogradskyella sp.]|uniref:carboxypeptidase-like regulatory domain-containing protein n=1 Tax=uncultured Winogradskyella sp. TaxID=395353 RepID=UPI00262B07C1|nr:carboxypeptidase-like regulatory domain-containing protein [uncultured Winogradskyella sp.]|tara:strand:- start:1314 stop:1748 length:435 start_codon:yes stop_codon:yes gene_type:complete
MKTAFTLHQTQNLKTLTFIGLMLMTLAALNPIYGQTATTTTVKTTTNERTIKGVVSDETETLLGVNIVLEGTTTGTTTNEKGEFTFPKKLKTGDVLLFSYLGYETQKVEIKDNTTFIELKLTIDSVTMIGALDSGKPYKSKRKN